MGHRAQKKAHLMNLGARPSSPWHVHVALTRRGLDLLGYQQRGVDRAFDAGMTGLSTGDPKQAVRVDGIPEPAHPRNWRVGGPARGIDVLVMLIAEVNMRAAIEPLRARLTGLGGIQIVYEELGEDPAAMARRRIARLARRPAPLRRTPSCGPASRRSDGRPRARRVTGPRTARRARRGRSET